LYPKDNDENSTVICIDRSSSKSKAPQRIRFGFHIEFDRYRAERKIDGFRATPVEKRRVTAADGILRGRATNGNGQPGTFDECRVFEFEISSIYAHVVLKVRGKSDAFSKCRRAENAIVSPAAAEGRDEN